MMRKFLINVLVFWGLVFIVDFFTMKLGNYLQGNAKGGYTKRTNDLIMKDCHDVLIMGSSRAHHHYDTPYLSDSLGVDVYNAGYDGNGVILAYGILELVLERYQPKLIILDIEPSFDIIKYSGDKNCIRYINYLKPYFNHDVVDKVIPEHGYFSSEIVEMIKTNLIAELDELSKLPLEELLENRYQRFRKF